MTLPAFAAERRRLQHGARTWASTPLEHWGVAGRAPTTRKSTGRRRRGWWGLGRGCAPSQKIYEFFISKWCDMVHSGCVVFKIHVLKGKIKHLSKYWGSSTQDDPCRSNIGGSRPLQPLRRWRLCARRYRLIAAGAAAGAGAQQQTRRPPLLLSIDGTDRRTDWRRTITAPHSTRLRQ